MKCRSETLRSWSRDIVLSLKLSPFGNQKFRGTLLMIPVDHSCGILYNCHNSTISLSGKSSVTSLPIYNNSASILSSPLALLWFRCFIASLTFSRFGVSPMNHLFLSTGGWLFLHIVQQSSEKLSPSRSNLAEFNQQSN